jgi:hypothetical protein
VRTFLQQLREHPLRCAGFLIVLVAVSYLGYCSVPHGYGKLAILEANVNRVNAFGASLDDVRAGLDTLGIKYSQRLERESDSVFEDGRGYKLAANEGELLLFSRHQTDAWQGPCSEQVWIFLLLICLPSSPARGLPVFPLTRSEIFNYLHTICAKMLP